MVVTLAMVAPDCFKLAALCHCLPHCCCCTLTGLYCGNGCTRLQYSALYTCTVFAVHSLDLLSILFCHSESVLTCQGVTNHQNSIKYHLNKELNYYIQNQKFFHFFSCKYSKPFGSLILLDPILQQ